MHCFTLDTGAKRESVLTKAAATSSSREPEGMAIQVVSGQPRLSLGVAGATAGDRRSNPLDKDETTTAA